MIPKQTQRLGGGFLRRVEESDEAGEDEIAFVFHRDGRMVLGQPLVAHCNDAKAVFIEPIAQYLELLAKLLREPLGTPFVVHF